MDEPNRNNPGEHDSPLAWARPTAADDKVDLRRRLEFLGLTADDAARLRALVAIFDGMADEFVERFYTHLFAFDETSRFLRDPRLVERLKLAQRDHLRSMLSAAWDDEYVGRRHQVGLAHADTGVEPQFFLGAYNQYVQHCLGQFVAGTSNAPSQQLAVVLSLLKAVFLDIGLTLDAYFKQSTQQLRQALDMLWERNHDLAQFAQLTSHDLKTPLATVANLCDEVLDEFGETVPQSAREMIDAARRQTFRMSRLIDKILASTIAPQSTESNEQVASGDVLAAALDRLKPQLDRSQIEVVAPDSFPDVWGNPVRLREAFYNVLSNAAKFIERRPGRIEIQVETDDAFATFCIIDNGPGIPPEELERIFAPFRRLPRDHDRPGSGLGLYFTRNLIERQGGRVWAESDTAGGSRFYIRLRRQHSGQPDTD